MKRKKINAIKEGVKTRTIHRYWVFLVFVIMAYEISLKFLEPRLFPVCHIRVDGHCERVNRLDLQQHISSHVRGFFSTNVRHLKEDMLSMPFVEEVVVKRVWPDSLNISIKEQQLVARWGDKHVMSSKGILTSAASHVDHLPRFDGPIGQEKNMLLQYQELIKILQPLHLAIANMQLNSRRSWEVTLDNGVRLLLGRNEISTHLLSLVSIWPKLIKRHNELIAVIDLRYPNGISIRSKD